MADQTVPTPLVTYSVADLLDRLGTRIDVGFATITEKLENKADKTDLAAINARLEEHSKEIAALKDHQQRAVVVADALKVSQVTRANWRRWAIEAAISAAATGGILAGVLH